MPLQIGVDCQFLLDGASTPTDVFTTRCIGQCLPPPTPRAASDIKTLQNATPDCGACARTTYIHTYIQLNTKPTSLHNVKHIAAASHTIPSVICPSALTQKFLPHEGLCLQCRKATPHSAKVTNTAQPLLPLQASWREQGKTLHLDRHQYKKLCGCHFSGKMFVTERTPAHA